MIALAVMLGANVGSALLTQLLSLNLALGGTAIGAGGRDGISLGTGRPR